MGYLYLPAIVQLLNVSESSWLTSSILGMIVGAIIFFYLVLFTSKLYCEFLSLGGRCTGQITSMDLFFGSIGLIVGLVIAYFVNMPLQDMSIRIFFAGFASFHYDYTWLLRFPGWFSPA